MQFWKSALLSGKADPYNLGVNKRVRAHSIYAPHATPVQTSPASIFRADGGTPTIDELADYLDLSGREWSSCRRHAGRPRRLDHEGASSSAIR